MTRCNEAQKQSTNNQQKPKKSKEQASKIKHKANTRQTKSKRRANTEVESFKFVRTQIVPAEFDNVEIHHEDSDVANVVQRTIAFQ